MGEHGPNIDPKWANIAPKWANIDVQGAFLQCPSGRSKVSEKKCFAGTVMRPRWPLGRVFLESILQHDPKTVQMGLMNDGSGSLFRPSGRKRFLEPRRPLQNSCSRPFSAHFLPRHGRCWAKPIQYLAQTRHTTRKAQNCRKKRHDDYRVVAMFIFTLH